MTLKFLLACHKIPNNVPKQIDRLIVNSPYIEPQQYWKQTAPYQFELLEGRRPASYTIADPQSKNREVGIVKELELANKIRGRVSDWRNKNYKGALPITKRLLSHWKDQEARGGEDAIQFFFCQLEAIETLIFLTEASPNDKVGLDIPSDGGDFMRWCCKMATGTGKTVVMSMVIAWQVLNAVTYKDKEKYSRNIFVVAPNLTVKDRLAVLHPSHPENYYEGFDIVPVDLMEKLRQANIKIENWHQLAWDTDEKIAKKKGVDKRGAKSDTAYVKEVLGDMATAKNILVINDEAHHAWRVSGKTSAKKDEVNEATVWVGGLDRIHRKNRILKCLDFSATPFAPSGKKSSSEAVFGWVVSDFGLNDAIESGLVKTPRVVIRDDGKKILKDKSRLYHIYADREVKDNLNQKKAKANIMLPQLVLNAYALLAEDWKVVQKEWINAGSKVPPSIITVANTTETAARIEYSFRKNLVEAGELCKEERILRIDSKVLNEAESQSETVKIDPNKEKLNKKEQAEILRRTVDTVGRVGKLGEQVCNIISVGMLSEGWDAKTVTHIMGLRAFSSQLLCEQVIGRGLRRVAYDIDPETKMFRPEYVNIFGVPFSFLPYEGGKEGGTVNPRPKTLIEAVDNKKQFAISFPNIIRIETLYKPKLTMDWDKVEPLVLDPYESITEAELSAIIDGKANPINTKEINLNSASHRMQNIIYDTTTRIYNQTKTNWKGNKAYLLVQLLKIVDTFVTSDKIRFKNDLFSAAREKQKRKVLIMLNMNTIVEHVIKQIKPQNTKERKPIFDLDRPILSTSDVRSWYTSKPIQYTEKSHINYLVIDSGWEATESYHLDKNKAVRAWVKNDHLGFVVWYTHLGIVRKYYPDFIIQLHSGDYIVLETKGQTNQESRAKRKALQDWIKAVNEDGRFGKWHELLSTHPNDVDSLIENIK